MNLKVAAVRAWTEWRSALHAATTHADPSTDKPGEDALSAMLRQWWREQNLPRLEQLSEPQADLVLAEIARLDWSCRPFDEAAG